MCGAREAQRTPHARVSQAKKPRNGTTTDGDVASVALVHKGRVLLARETRSGTTLDFFDFWAGKQD